MLQPRFAGVLWFLLGTAACHPAALSPLPPPDHELARAEAGALLDDAVGRLLAGEPEVRTRIEHAAAEDPLQAAGQLWAAWAAAAQADEEVAFEHLLQAARLSEPLAELAAWEAFRLFTTRDQALRLSSALAERLTCPGTNPLARARLQVLRGQILRFIGQSGEAARAFHAVGLVRDWLVIGPFDNDQNSGFDAEFPPETEPLNTEAAYRGKLKEVRWRRAEPLDYDGRVNLSALLDPSLWTTAYLSTFVYSDREQPIAVRLAAHRGVKLWLNGALVLADDEAERPAFDQHVAGARLARGWNRLLVKVCQRTGAWQLRLRLTDPTGEPLPDLRVRAEPAPSAPVAALEGPTPEVAQSGTHWVPDDPAAGVATTSAAAMARVLWLKHSGFLKRAAAEAAALAEAHPSCALLVALLSRVQFEAGNEGLALRALAAAERLAPGLPDALLQRAEYERRHRRLERAMRVLTPLHSTADPLPAVRGLWTTLLAGRGWNTDALREARALAERQPGRSWAWRTIGDLHARLDQPQAARAAWRRSLALRADGAEAFDRLANQAQAAGRDGEALDWLDQKLRFFPLDLQAAALQAEILLADNRGAAALARCDELARVAPDWSRVARLRGDILYRQGRTAEALEQYRQALELQPAAGALREYVDFLVNRPDPVFEHYGLSDAEVEQVLNQPIESEAHPEAAAIFLLDDHVSHVFEDGSAKHLVHQLYLVRDDRGRQALSHFRVPADDSFRLEVAETLQPDGSRQEATSIRPGIIHFPSLAPGSRLHVAYRYDSRASSWMQDHFNMTFHFQGDYPSQRARWVLALPPDRELRYLVRGVFIHQQREAFADQQVWIFSAEKAPMLHTEPFRPPLRELQAAVHTSTVPDWEALARWQNSLIQDQFTIDEPIRRKTHELVAGAGTLREKVTAIYDFIAREIRYLNNDVGIFGKKPNRALEVFENRFGDCKDKATLMIAMLRELGIEAHYAAILTRNQGPVFWEVPFAQTNHIITYLPAQPGLERDWFVDGTNRFGNVDALPEIDQDVRALVLDGKGYRLVDTPRLPPENSRLQFKATAAWLPGDALRLTATEDWSGWFAASRRASMPTAGKRAEEFAKELNSRYPGARLTEVTFENLDDLGPRAGAHYTSEIGGLVRRQGDRLQLRPLWPLRLVPWLARSPQRHYDIFLLLRLVLDCEIRVPLPAGLKAVELPETLRIDNPWLGYERSCVQGDGMVTCRRSFTLRADRVPREGYDELRALCLRIDQAEEQELVLGP